MIDMSHIIHTMTFGEKQPIRETFKANEERSKSVLTQMRTITPAKINEVVQHHWRAILQTVTGKNLGTSDGS